MSVVAKPLIDLDRVWYEWIQDSKMLQKGKARRRRAAPCSSTDLIVLAGNEDMHKISDKFEFWPDLTIDYGVSCP